MIYLHTTNAARLDACREARAASEAEARRSCGRGGYLKSRGFEISGSVKGTKVTEAGTWTWDGTGKDLEATIATLRERFADLDEVWIEGGFDWAVNVRAMTDGDYDPWVSDWAVLAWKAAV